MVVSAIEEWYLSAAFEKTSFIAEVMAGPRSALMCNCIAWAIFNQGLS